MFLFASRKTREEIREWLSLAQDVRDFILSLWAALRGERYEDAREILETRIREQAAGKAAHEASSLAGPRRGG